MVKEDANTCYQNDIEKCDHELEIAYHNGDKNVDELRKKKTTITNQYNLVNDNCNKLLEWIYQIKDDGIETLLSENAKTK